MGVPGMPGVLGVAGQQYGYPYQQQYAGPYAYPGYAAGYPAQAGYPQGCPQPGYPQAGYAPGFGAGYPAFSGYYGQMDPSLQVSTHAHRRALVPFLSAAFHLLASLYTLPAHILLRGVEVARKAPDKIQVQARGLRQAGRHVGQSLAEHLTLDALARRHRAQLDRADRDAKDGFAALLVPCLTDQFRDTQYQQGPGAYYQGAGGYGYAQQGYGYPRYY